MDWLQSLDASLFHFINSSLSNSFFDWLMPILSGRGVMSWFALCIVVALVSALWFGNARVRLCALMLFLVVALGDPLVINTIKHAVARPRPCMGPTDVVQRLGCSGSGSMPSAHAANWFAVTTIVFLFYRRSLWFMLPMALAVSFSRVYCGVHYPSDVLAGAILGAGYGVAGMVALQSVWNRAGKKWFPLWHAQMPSLLNAECVMRNAESKTALDPRPSTLDSHWLYLGYILIFLMLVGRWLYIASGIIQLSQDEAYQWIWSKHLALSYYSKPLGIALIQFAGTSLWDDTELGVRFFSPLFTAILSVMVLRFVAREINARAAFWLLLIVTAVPLLGVGSILMTIDPPLVLCWMWALIAGWRAVQPDGQTRHWLIVGLAMGLGFLCKYSELYQFVCWAVFFALWPASRAHLRKPGPWFALLIFLVCTLPVVIWNWQHGWITIQHVAGDAGLHSRWKPTLRYFWDFVGSESLLLNPVFLIGSIVAIFGFWKLRREKPLWLYLFCMSAPVLLGHLAYSLHSRVMPNWIAVAILPMLCLMVAFWDARWRTASRWLKPCLVIGLAFGFLIAAFMYDSKLIGKIAGQPLPGEKDMSRRWNAWKQSAELVESEREKLQREGKPAFIICNHYGITGLYSFYSPQAKAVLKSEPLIYPMILDHPENQFYFWPEYNYLEYRKGQNAIFVSEVDQYPLESGSPFKWKQHALLPDFDFHQLRNGWLWKWLTHQPVVYARIPPPKIVPEQIVGEFQSVTDLGEREIKVGDRVFHRVHLWACYNLK